MVLHITGGVLLFAFALLFISAFKRKSVKTDEKIAALQEQSDSFFQEYDALKSRFVAEAEEQQLKEKWSALYSEVSKCRISKKHKSFERLQQFKAAYKAIHENIKKSNAQIKRQEQLSELAENISVFFAELFDMTKAYVSHSAQIRFSEKWKGVFECAKNIEVYETDSEYADIERFKKACATLNDFFHTANEMFIQSESERHDMLFSNIDGKSLDEQQRRAVITDEDRILVLAGAGSGKTLTIAAKVKYLCEIKNVAPSEILLISFTKKSAQEMTERIQNALHIPAEAATFHKLGLEIIKKADGFRPEIFDEQKLREFIHGLFEKEILNHPELIKNLTEYFAYFLEVPKNLEDYDSLGELYEEEKNADLETLKSKYEREKYIQNAEAEKSAEYVTLQNEKVKSLEETKIANFLFMNGVNYEYEKLYPFESEDALRKSYRPDFYLTDYGIYLEHFGISKNGTVPWLSKIEEKKYLDGMEWKRNFHNEHGTKLLETYSYYSSEGILLDKLKVLLLANGVSFKPRDFTDIFNTVYASKSSKYFLEFMNLCCTFITLFKSNDYSIKEIDVLKQKYTARQAKPFLRERTSLFLDIIKILLCEYQGFLQKNKAIDFSDMINDAAKKAERCNAGTFPYRYVIVDEYQDISKSRFNLLKVIADNSKAKLFCVGDDWQSIYRFAGSDISLFTDFENYFGYTKILKIEKTYRNSQHLIDEASRFVLKNPLQLHKLLRSDKDLRYPVVFWGYDGNPEQALMQVINKIIFEFGEEKSILLLGRTNYDSEIIKKSNLFKSVKRNGKEMLQYRHSPRTPVEFLSVHRSKGLEADNVVIVNFKNDKLGFPNQISDDEVLGLVLASGEDFAFAEERRLFYVALTRTKNRTFVLTDSKNPSPFFKEFEESASVCFVLMKKDDAGTQSLCPRCKTGILLKVENKESRSYFVGCSNFPRCRYTVNDSAVLFGPKKCPSCGGFLVKRKGKNGHWFTGCTNYPCCKHTEQLN